jgi:circadian clock protein KaiC
LHLHELIAFLNQKGVVTFLIYTQHGLIDSMQTEVDVSYLADTVILLRHFEAEGEIRQVLSVIKQRVGQHERGLRELRMSEKGIDISETLSNFRGVLTGAPDLLGQTGQKSGQKTESLL